MSDKIEEDEVVAVECIRCSDIIEDGDGGHCDDGDPVCDDCMFVCERCEYVQTIDHNSYEVDGSYQWCEDCTESYSNYCESCNERHTGDTYFVEDANEYYCEDCVSSSAIWCDNCSTYNIHDCTNCEGDGGRRIHDYSYRPDPIFHGDGKLFFGIEVETEAPRSSYEALRDAAEYAYQLEDADLAYLKSDGSLSVGFELVTHPMTHDYYMNEAPLLWETISKLRDEYKMRAWSTGTCGLHVHISRAGFSNGSHMHRFLRLIYSNEKFYSRLAGRDSSRWAKFSDVSVSDNLTGKTYNKFKDKIERGRDTDRYSAVNTQNRATFEMRIFRGTVNVDTIKSAIDLAHASVEYTRGLTVSEVRDGALDSSKFIQYIHDNKNTYPSLIARMNRLFIGATLQDIE